MPPRLGLITIGQTPRPDLAQQFAAAVPGAVIDLRGALDPLSTSAARALAAPDDAHPLLVRLRDGSTVHISLTTIHAQLVPVAEALVADGAYAIVVACAGAMPDVPVPVPVLLPGRLLSAAARALVREPRIGVVSPMAAQLPSAEAKWRADGFDPVLTWAAPGNDAELDGAARAMRTAAPSLVVLDCMGHDEHTAHRFARQCGRPVLAAQPVTARLAGALLPPA